MIIFIKRDNDIDNRLNQNVNTASLIMAGITGFVLGCWFCNNLRKNEESNLNVLKQKFINYINYNEHKFTNLEKKLSECDYNKNLVNEALRRLQQKRLENQIIKPNTSYIK